MGKTTYYVRHEHWRRLLLCFSDQAKVIELDLEMGTNPLGMEESVFSFRWPTPAMSYRVAVLEPDPDHLLARLPSAGVPSNALEVALDFFEHTDEVIPTEENSMIAGSSLPLSCPNCSTGLRVAPDDKAIQLTREVAIARHEMLRHEPCDRHGIHIHIGPQVAIGVECPSCLETYVIINGHVQLFHVRLDS